MHDQTMDSPYEEVTRLVRTFYERYSYSNVSIDDQRRKAGWVLNCSHIFYQRQHRFKKTHDCSILDAGCGGGDITVIAALNNPGARITAVDLSLTSLERARLLASQNAVSSAHFHQADILQLELKERFDFIICSGVLHHLADPRSGLERLTDHLKPDGLLLLYMYSKYGRWEIGLIQEIAALLEPDQTRFEERKALVQQLLAGLPKENRLVQFFNRPALALNQQGSHFMDMYVNPNEYRYSLPEIFSLLDTAGLSFAGFLDPSFWDIENYVKDPGIAARAAHLPMRERYHLVELLNPDIMGYSFFARRKEYLPRKKVYTDEQLLRCYPLINPAAWVVEGKTIVIGDATIPAAIRNINLIPQLHGAHTIAAMAQKIHCPPEALASLLGVLRVMEENCAIMFLEESYKPD